LPTIDENLRHWRDGHDWSTQGEEWSRVWGGSESQWQGSILPRIRALLPVRRAVEIGCGFGRWTRRLRPWCEGLVAFDLVEECVVACRERFRGDSGAEFLRTDGRSLTGVAAGSVDLVFSFDSLVHAEQDVLDAYVAEIARVLSPDGVAFLHHSNFGAVLAEHPGSGNLHWRGESARGSEVIRRCPHHGLKVLSQEIVDWGGVEDCDAFSLIARADSSRAAAGSVVRKNPYFMGEAQSLAVRAALYGVPEERRPPGRSGLGRYLAWLRRS
jgi:SAM-dependent methyltransferase